MDKEPGVTVKQMNFIKTLVSRDDSRKEPDYSKLTMNGAKELIADWLGKQEPKQAGEDEAYTKSEKVPSIAFDRDKSIIAQCLTKCVYVDVGGSAKDVVTTYKDIYKAL